MSSSDFTSQASTTFFSRWLLPALKRPVTYLLTGSGILLIDVLTGPFLMFPILFIIPVTCAAWFHTVRWAYALAVSLPAARFIVAALIESAAPAGYLAANALVRMAVLVSFAFLVTRTARQTRELEREVRLLRGILPICMFCKRVRDERQEWEEIEAYIAQHSEADFSHGLCPECAQKHYGDCFEKHRVG
jgi:hypothetical protein